MDDTRAEETEAKSVESMRQRLQILMESLDSMRRDLYQSNPLPSPDSLQASAKVLTKNLKLLQRLLVENHSLFSRTVLHPSTNYPGRTQEHILGSLLRKKLEPDVEVDVEAARQAAISAGVDAQGMKRKADGDEDDDDEDEEEEEEEENNYREEKEQDDDAADGEPLANLWAAVSTMNMDDKTVKVWLQRMRRNVFTGEERQVGIENVRTGLKMDLVAIQREVDEEYAGAGDDEDDEEEEEEEEEEDGADGKKAAGDEDVVMLDQDPALAPRRPPAPVQTGLKPREASDEEILFFMNRGETVLPRGIETEETMKAAVRAKKAGLNMLQMG